MKIYLLCQEVDQGYSVLFAHKDETECRQNLEFLVSKHYDDGWIWNPKYFIEEIELK